MGGHAQGRGARVNVPGGKLTSQNPDGPKSYQPPIDPSHFIPGAPGPPMRRHALRPDLVRGCASPAGPEGCAPS